METEKVVGFVSNLYYTPKGHSYVVRDMLKILKEAGYTIHMYRIGDHPEQDEFEKPDTIKSNKDRIILKEDFEKWLDEKRPSWCVFMEYGQWWMEDHDKLLICKERGIKTAGFLIQEKLDWNKIDHYKLYTKIICPTGYQTRLMRMRGLYNTVHVPWGTDIKEIDEVSSPTRTEEDEGAIIFYHCAGSGGVDNRKNTTAIIDAYRKIKDNNTRLMITHLSNRVFGRNEIISFMKYADVVVNTSKWDTLGLNSLESNACGRPVLVCDGEPMNELVKDRVNGFCVEAKVGKSPNVTCPSYDVDVDDLAKKMEMLKNKEILDVLKNNSRHFAEFNFDWEKNKKHLLEVFEKNG